MTSNPIRLPRVTRCRRPAVCGRNPLTPLPLLQPKEAIVSKVSLFEVLARYQGEDVSLEVAPLHPDGCDGYADQWVVDVTCGEFVGAVLAGDVDRIVHDGTGTVIWEWRVA